MNTQEDVVQAPKLRRTTVPPPKRRIRTNTRTSTPTAVEKLDFLIGRPEFHHPRNLV